MFSSLNTHVIRRSGSLANMNNPFLCLEENEVYPREVQRPSGIGLHLNRIVSSVPTVLDQKSYEIASPNTIAMNSLNSVSNMGNLSETCFVSTRPLNGDNNDLSLPAMNSVSNMGNLASEPAMNSVSNMGNLASETCFVSTNLSLPAMNSVSNMGYLASETCFVSTIPLIDMSASETCFVSTIPLNADDQSNLCDNGTSNPETTSSEDLSSYGPNKRRKIVGSNHVSYRRCKCQKTKCLKLYCDCFAAREYCDKLCACQGCYNSELYEDTVSIAQEKILSRNPDAFDSKIQQDAGTYSTTSSARHKRGCNCKKSKCLKKYCECYQANLGCSDGCRCEGCENILGRKDEYAVKNNSILEQGTDEADDFFSDLQLEIVAQQDDLSIYHNMTPTEASIQFPTYEEGTASSLYSGAIIDTSYGIPTESTFHDPFGLTLHDPFDAAGVTATPNSQNWVSNTNDQIENTSSVNRHALPIDQTNHYEGNRFLGMHEISTTESLTLTPTPTDTLTTSDHETAKNGSSSTAVRTARKFILQAVPSSPFIDEGKK